MEEQFFNEIRQRFCLRDSQINPGKMMSSEAITYRGRVFAFFSRKKKMVFKLGKDFNPHEYGLEISVFNPFTRRQPLYGWFEVPFAEKEQWEPLAQKAINQLKSEL
ncbi:MAG: hypothetical protein AAF632_25375 [Bacteroidota bacterium]